MKTRKQIELLIQREIWGRANLLIQHIYNHNPELITDFENLFDDSTETIEEWLLYEADDDELSKIIENNKYNLSDDLTIGMVLDELCSEEKEYIACQLGFEPPRKEIFEHWVVSDWLATHLSQFSEPVAHDILDFHIWGRTCTGQNIALDTVMLQIVEATDYGNNGV